MGIAICLLAVAAVGLLAPDFFTNHMLHGLEEHDELENKDDC